MVRESNPLVVVVQLWVCVCVLHLFELASIEELASQGGGQMAVMQGNRVTVSL